MQQCALAAAGLAGQRDAFTLLKVEIDATQHMDRFAGRGESLGEISDAQHDEWRRAELAELLRSTLAAEMPGCVGLEAVVSSQDSQIKKVPKDIDGGES
ncbi:hypothetical protein BwSH20_22190 [Bradyrhizobium ottawaense]|nr:hypothetical protein SG09_06560 [Bradyrhizobium ottawaense]GMO20498.1 hypothetical protein BwSF12_10590 [Bradyrhizobium ottawaense]GMO21548.1 hypothetical protein BwSF21_16250 [Bradyrhizobium ottawaense]GMO30414.1 hypothetical protein BwSH14_32500 [Bradyrhizobium ottawaense]GMO56810.1 hypothetical protein BwSG20_06920 [Bradyrhizobium ottawaense]